MTCISPFRLSTLLFSSSFEVGSLGTDISLTSDAESASANPIASPPCDVEFQHRIITGKQSQMKDRREKDLAENIQAG
jgi:hypothetical protein